MSTRAASPNSDYLGTPRAGASGSGFGGLSGRGAQMRHAARNPHLRHMSDVRGAIGCYYCWLGQYDRCEHTCHLVRSTVDDHSVLAMQIPTAAAPPLETIQPRAADAEGTIAAMARCGANPAQGFFESLRNTNSKGNPLLSPQDAAAALFRARHTTRDQQAVPRPTTDARLLQWDAAAPVLSHAAAQSQTIFRLQRPDASNRTLILPAQESLRLSLSVYHSPAAARARSAGAGAGGATAARNNSGVAAPGARDRATSSPRGGLMATNASRHTSLRRVLPEENPYTYSNAKFLDQGVTDRAHTAADHHHPEKQQLFSLLQPVQYIPPFRYPFGATTIQATPYTKIAVQQRRDPAAAGSAGAAKRHDADVSAAAEGAFYLSMGDRGVRRRAASSGVHYLKSRNKFISPDSAIWSGALAHGASSAAGATQHQKFAGAVNDDELDEAAAEWDAESATADGDASMAGFSATASTRKRQQMGQHLRAALNEAELRALRQPSTAEQLRAALDGRFALPLKELPDGRVPHRHHRAGGGGGGPASPLQTTTLAPQGMRHAPSRSTPRVTTQAQASDILAGNFSHAADMPLPRTFWSSGV